MAVLVAGAVVAPASAGAAPRPVTKITHATENFQRPDVVSGRLAAALTKHDILVTGDTTATSLTYVRPDGSSRTEVSPVPVRVKRGSAWSGVDYSLVATKEGFAPKASPVDVVFSGGGDGPAVRLDQGKQGLGLSWAKALPKPTIGGDSAFYQLSPTEILVLTATSDGFEQSLMLTAPPATAPRLRLGFDTTGLDLVANGTGGYDFVKSGDHKTALFTMPKPKMYSSAVVGEEHTQTQAVPVTLGTERAGDHYLDLSAGMPFLTDPKTVYPVWIDPAVSSVSRYGDTYVTQADADSHVSDPDLRIGLSSNGNLRRSLIRFSTTNSVPPGAHVTSATLNLYNNTSSTCAARSMAAYPVTEQFTLTSATWANQPSYNTSSAYSASASWSHGNEDLGCPNATGSITLTNMVQAWVSGTIPDYGLILKAGSETDASYAKYFCSMNADTTAASACTTNARYPTLSVVYNTYGGVPTGGTFSPRVAGTVADSYVTGQRIYSTSLTPTFSAKLSNADGGKVALQVKLSHDVNIPSEGTGEVTTLTSAAVNPGAKASVTVPAGLLPATTRYMYQMRSRVVNGNGGYDYSAWTPSSLTSTTTTKFALNTGLPAAPTITCGSYPAGVWSAKAAATTSCSFDTTATDGSGYFWGMDDPSTPNLAVDSSNLGNAVAVTTIPTTVGWHTLYARSRDTALHLSTGTTAYTFGVGAGGVLSPAPSDSTAKAVALSASANSSYTQVTYQWAPGTTSTTWSDLPVADVTPAGSSTPISAWPLSGTTSGGLTSFAGSNWNVASTLAAAAQPDGALRIRAKFTTASGTVGYSAENTFSLAVTTFGKDAATTAFGPGEVSLTTGDFQVTADDVSVGGLGIGRSATSLAPAAANTGPTGIFGAGWKASLPGTGAGEGAATLIDNSAAGSVAVQDANGTESVYVKQADGSYLGVGAADDGGKLIKSTTIANPANSGDTTAYTGWQLTGTDGTVTTWLKSTSGVWATAWIDEPGKESETTYARDGNGRVTTVLAPVPAGVTCTTASFGNPGCSALRLTYATATTATGTDEATWGNYSGLVSGISWTAYDPAASAMVTKQVAAYAYDSTGHLRAAWDPRLSTPLKTRYTYNAAGRLATVTPPGLNGWTTAYDSRGRIANVSRTDPANGTATQAIAYDLPVSGAAGAPDVSGTTAATWGQVGDLAYSGAAVFPASHVPAAGSGGAYAPAAADWPYATVTYADVDGDVVDNAAYGAGAWQIDATRYDDNGNEVWTLTAGNRAQALAPTATTDPYVASQGSSAARANLLATIDTYDADGVDPASTLGPAHPVQLASGDTASVRVRSSYTYDAGAPTTDGYHLLTKTVTTPVALDGSTVAAADTITKTTGYNPIDGSSATGATSGWTLHEPTTETTGDLTTQIRYDAAGRAVESRLPGSAATDASTTLTTYYTAAANSTYPACGGKPYFAGKVCRTDPGGAPSTGNPVTAKAYTYDLYGQPLTVTETSGTVVRTTTNTYDEAGRNIGSSVAVAGLTGSTPAAAINRGFDPATGLAITTTQGSAVLTSAYDALGRRTGYTDADGATSAATFDIDGRTASFTDTRTTAYTYDSATEHRGLLTGIADPTGAYSGGYDAAGKLTGQTYPNGLTAAYAYDNTGDATGLVYTVAGGTLEFTAVPDASGKTVHAESPLSAQDFTYDTAGRLNRVGDTVAGTCTTRAYGFDKHSNRTSLTTYAATDAGDCQTTTAASTVTSTFDSADRITDAGYTYDRLGRTLTTPAGTPLTVAYYDTDLPSSLSQGSLGQTFTFDPNGRYRTIVDSTSGAETRRMTNHYGDDEDAPSFISVSTDGGATAGWTRNVRGLDGKLAATNGSDGTATLNLTNLHGDVVATVPDTAGATVAAYFESTEYGLARDATITNRYGWLGGAQRATDSVASLVLMGVRLYNPATGRFLTTDPVAGGNANPYVYPSDPVNSFDLNGQKRHGYFKRHWWGLSVYLTEWATNRLEAFLAAGSGIAWVASELTSWTGIGGLSAGAIAAILAAAVGIVWVCDWSGRGIGIHYGWWGSFWCWGR